MTPKQMSLSMRHDVGFERHRKATRQDVLLAEMDQVAPSAELCAAIEPYYPKEPVGGGRRPLGLERMLRIHFPQQWYALSDPTVEEALYDSAAMRRFVGIDLGCVGAPDETTACKFRRLLEKRGLAGQLFAVMSEHLKRHGMKLSQGTIVDATTIAAPPSTRNKGKTRDAEMHQTKKGNQWHLGMKAHIGVDEYTGLVHAVVSTAANVANVVEVPNCYTARNGTFSATLATPARRSGRRNLR